MRILLILTVLVAAGLACNIPGDASTLPPTAKPMTTEEVRDLSEQIQKTLQQPNAAGDVTITLTQDQVNSIIAGQVQQQQDLGITDTSVVLTGGNMEIYGKVNQNNISANLKVVMQPQIDAKGEPVINIVSMSLGGLPVPDVLKERVATAAEDALTNYLNSSNNLYKVKSITIGEGQMTIVETLQ